MTAYALLDRVADAHNPVLGLPWIGLAGRAPWRRTPRAAGSIVLGGLASLAVAYGLAGLDRSTGLWADFALDYSTHTAVAVAMLATLRAASRTMGRLALAMVLLYVPLMLVQGDLGGGDIASTALAVALFVGVPAWRARRRGGPAAQASAAVDGMRAT